MRGVNKLVVEIKDPDSQYFDRCLLFLRPHNGGVPQNELNDGARKLLNSVMNSGKKRHSLPIAAAVFLTIAAALCGVLIGVLIF